LNDRYLPNHPHNSKISGKNIFSAREAILALLQTVFFISFFCVSLFFRNFAKKSRSYWHSEEFAGFLYIKAVREIEDFQGY